MPVPPRPQRVGHRVDRPGATAWTTADLATEHRPTGHGPIDDPAHALTGSDGPEGTTGPRDFTTFYRQSYDRLAGALVLTLGDRDLGQEAADEAMVRTYQRWSTVQTYDNPGGWAYRVGLNWARSLHRKLARRLPFHTPHATYPTEVPDPAITAALADLDVRMRAVVVCRLLLDWSVEETAAALKIRPGTVKSRLHRALSILETTLEDTR